jgi:ketosteroid isomerase-like protein
MSTDFVDLVRASYPALSRGDVEFLIAYADPEIEIVEPPGLPDARTYRGHDGLAEGIRRWGGESGAPDLDVERVIDAGHERVIVFVRQSGHAASGEERRVDLHTGRDGKAIRWEIFNSLDDAFAAIGLRKLRGET